MAFDWKGLVNSPTFWGGLGILSADSRQGGAGYLRGVAGGLDIYRGLQAQALAQAQQERQAAHQQLVEHMALERHREDLLEADRKEEARRAALEERGEIAGLLDELQQNRDPQQRNLLQNELRRRVVASPYTSDGQKTAVMRSLLDPPQRSWSDRLNEAKFNRYQQIRGEYGPEMADQYLNPLSLMDLTNAQMLKNLRDKFNNPTLPGNDTKGEEPEKPGLMERGRDFIKDLLSDDDKPEAGEAWAADGGFGEGRAPSIDTTSPQARAELHDAITAIRGGADQDKVLDRLERRLKAMGAIRKRYHTGGGF